MRLPWWLQLAVGVLVVSAAGTFYLEFSTEHVLRNLADAAMILTLAAILVYVYYNGLLARVAWEPSASYHLQPVDGDAHALRFAIQNHSKVGLRCRCKITATVFSQPVVVHGFYSGTQPWEIQPFRNVSRQMRHLT